MDGEGDNSQQALEQEASMMGWLPKDQFKGDESQWVDAQAYVEKGRQITPILRKNNERLLAELAAERAKTAKLEGAVGELSESIKDLKSFHEESTKAQVAKARADILRDLREAKQEGDVDAEVDAQARLSEFDAAGKAAATPPVRKPEQTSQDPIAPEVAEWQKRNPWFGTDLAKTGMAQGIATELRAQGDKTVGKEFLDKVTELVEARLGGGQRKPGKVEGGDTGGAGGSSSGGTGYNNLPKDAREVCDAQAKKFVGENKVFKSKAEWNAHFAEQYFRSN